MHKGKRRLKYSIGNAAALVLGVSLLSSSGFASFSALKLDRVHSKVAFTAATLLFDVDGEFRDFTVNIDGDPAKPETVKVEANIDVASIDTKNQKRDDHLRSPAFFDAAKYPKIRFASIGVKSEGDELIVKGNLTIHGKTKLVNVPFKVVKGKNGAGIDTTTYKAKLTIDRTEFGVGTDSIAAKISLEDEVEVKLLIVTFQ